MMPMISCLPEGDASHIHRLCRLFFLSIGLSTFTDFRRMPEYLQRNPEELWQLDEHSPFPDEVEIVVLEDRPLKGYIRPKGNLNTPFTKDNIIEVNLMFLIAYIKSPFRKELCIGMYKTAIFFHKKDFQRDFQKDSFLRIEGDSLRAYFFQNLARNEILSC